MQPGPYPSMATNAPPSSFDPREIRPAKAWFVVAALLVDVAVVVERDDRGGLDRPGHHEAGVLAQLGQVVDEVGITRVEADPGARQVRPLRQGVHGQHALEAVGHDGAPRTVPRELDVALVGQHGHPVPAAPRRRRAQVVDSAGRVARRVDPHAEGPLGVLGGDVVEIGVGHRPAPGQRGAHRVGGVADLWVQDGVSSRRP